jgi:hypothetical protein
MYQHQIIEMLKTLRPVLKSQKQAQQLLEKHWRDQIAIVWDIADVHREANECETVLTNKEAREILRELLDQHDAMCGISKFTLATAIKDGIRGRKLTKRELKRFLDKDIITVQK